MIEKNVNIVNTHTHQCGVDLRISLFAIFANLGVFSRVHVYVELKLNNQLKYKIMTYFNLIGFI